MSLIDPSRDAIDPDGSATRLSATGAAVLAERVLGYLDRTLALVLAMLLLTLFAVVLATTVLRYVFGSGYVASEDVGIWLNTALTFLGLPLAMRGPLSMRLDIVTSRLGPVGLFLADRIADAAIVAAALTLVSGTATVTAMIGGTSPTLGLPKSWRYLPAAVGGGLAVLAVPLRSLAAGRSWPATIAPLAAGALVVVFVHLAPAAPVPLPSLVAAAVAALLFAIGTPLVASLIVGLAVSIPFGARLPEAALVEATVSGVGKFLLVAIPFFLLAGMLMNVGGLAHRLVRFATALVGHRRGGLAQACLVTNLLFAGVSGSSIADAAFGAKVLAPSLVADGVPPAKAGAIVAATAVLPNIVPPSIALLLLASATDLSVGALFSGGLVAGLVLAVALAVMLDRDAVPPRRGKAPATELRRAFLGATPAFGLAAVVFLGIRLGLATPTEAASIAAAYALFATLAAHDGPRLVAGALLQTGREASAIGLLVAASAPLTFLVAVDGLPQALASLTAAVGGGPLSVMLIANLVLLAVGAVLDVGPAILLFAPLMLPLATAAGIDPVAFGVLLVINLMIGGLTPPVGVLIYVTSGVAAVPPRAVFRAVLPLTLALAGALMLMALATALWACR